MQVSAKIDTPKGESALGRLAMLSARLSGGYRTDGMLPRIRLATRPQSILTRLFPVFGQHLRVWISIPSPGQLSLISYFGFRICGNFVIW
jgi:hypothetical protein